MPLQPTEAPSSSTSSSSSSPAWLSSSSSSSASTFSLLASPHYAAPQPLPTFHGLRHNLLKGLKRVSKPPLPECSALHRCLRPAPSLTAATPLPLRSLPRPTKALLESEKKRRRRRLQPRRFKLLRRQQKQKMKQEQTQR